MRPRKNILFLSHVTFMGGAEMYLTSIFKALNQDHFQGYFISQAPGDLTTEAERYRVGVELVKMRGWRKLKYFVHNRLTVKRLVEFCKEHHIDLIYSNCYRVTPYGVMAAKECGIPVMTCIQDFVPQSKLKNFMVLDCDRVMTVSRAIADTISPYYRGDIMTIYNGIDAIDYESRAVGQPPVQDEFPLAAGKRIVSLIAHVVPWKGHKDFLDAMAIVARSHPDTVFMIVGNALYPHQLTLQDIRDYAKTLKIDDRVIFTGERDDVPRILRDSDVVVQTSHREAFCRVLIEAMVMRKPVVATKCGGPQEIVVDGETGYLTDIGNAAQLASRVGDLLADAKTRGVMGEAGRKRVETVFSPEKTILRVNAIFDETVKGPALV